MKFFFFSSDIKGRLLTPEEGCGHSEVAQTRIVGGKDAKVGEFFKNLI